MPARVWVASTRRTLGDLRTGVRWKLVTRSRQAQPETRTWPAYVTVSQPLGHTVAYGYKDLRFRNSLPHPIALPINE